MQIDARKADTRRKIELGGLVIMAELDELDRVVILGALAIAHDVLMTGEGVAMARKRGEVEFAKKRNLQ
jgi:hypothetical protein